jgi:hypothetical protein
MFEDVVAFEKREQEGDSRKGVARVAFCIYEEVKMKVDERKVSQTGSGAITICLPRWWCRSRNLKGGNIVTLTLDGEALKIEPKVEK